MPDKKLTVLLQLQDKFSRVLKQAQGGFGKLRKSLLSVKTAMAGLGIYTLTRQIKSLIDAANKQETADAQLAASLRAVGLASDETFQYLKQLADQFQLQTTYGNEAIEQMEALFLRYKISPSLMRPMIQATIDYARAIGKDLRTATLDMAKAAQGNLMMLQRYGVEIDKAEIASRGLIALVEAVSRKFKGAEAAYTGTFAGKMSQLRNAFGDLKEELGFMITKSEAWKETLSTLTVSIREMTQQVQEGRGGWATLSTAIADMTNTIAKGLPDVAELVGQFVNFVNGAFKILGTTLAGVSASLVNLFKFKFREAWEVAQSILPEIKTQVNEIGKENETASHQIKSTTAALKTQGDVAFTTTESLKQYLTQIRDITTNLRLQKSAIEIAQEEWAGAFEHLKQEGDIWDEIFEIKPVEVATEGAQQIQTIYDYTAGSIARTFSDLFMGVRKNWAEALKQMMADLVAWLTEATIKAAILKYIFRIPAGGVGGAMLGFLGLKEGGVVKGVKPLRAFQEGGVVTRPTLALIGEGSEREYIIPESKFPKPEVYVTIHNANPDTYAEVLVKMGDHNWDEIVRRAVIPAIRRAEI